MSNPRSKDAVILHTPRLRLRLADPDSEDDCKILLDTYNDSNAGKGGNSRVGVSSIESVREKHRKMGPETRPDLCTLAPPPKGMSFLIYLPPNLSTISTDQTSEEKEEGPYVGKISMTFRPEMPYPDLGYGIRGEYEGKGYASEAGKEVLKWWREVIGVREVWAGTLPDNVRSQRCAERIGFVRAGTMDVVFGNPPEEKNRVRGAVGFVLPGMEGRWVEGQTVYPTI